MHSSLLLAKMLRWSSLRGGREYFVGRLTSFCKILHLVPTWKPCQAQARAVTRRGRTQHVYEGLCTFVAQVKRNWFCAEARGTRSSLRRHLFLGTAIIEMLDIKIVGINENLPLSTHPRAPPHVHSRYLNFS